MKNQRGGLSERSKTSFFKKPHSASSRFFTSHAGKGFISFKSFLAVTTMLALVGSILAGAAFLSIWLYKKATTSDFFTTTHIDVAGNTRLSREMVLKYGGISEGDNSLSVSIADVERNLRNTPWVREASVKRLLPDRFVIRIQERMPSFWVRKDDTLYYANERGEIIAPVESVNFLSLPTLTIMPGAEDSVDCLAKLLADLRNGALPIESGSIAQIVLNPANGVEIQLEDRNLKLAIATDDWEGNLNRLGLALSDMAKRRELGHAREIRSVDGQVWVIRNSQRAN